MSTQNKEPAFFRKQSVTFMILYGNEIDHRKSDHAKLVFANLTSRIKEILQYQIQKIFLGSSGLSLV